MNNKFNIKNLIHTNLVLFIFDHKKTTDSVVLNLFVKVMITMFQLCCHRYCI